MTDPTWGTKPHRIAYVAQSSEKVVRRYLSRLERLREEGFEVHLYAGDDGGFEKLQSRGIITRRLPVKSPRNPVGLMAAYPILQGYLLESRPLLVHAFDHRLLWTATFAARQADVPVVFATLTDHWLKEDGHYLPGALQARLQKARLQKAEARLNDVLGGPLSQSMRTAYQWLGEQVDKYLVTTEFDFELALKEQLAPAEKLEIIIGGSGVDVTRAKEGDDRESRRDESRRRLQLPESWRQVVGWVGPLSARHGGEDLLATIDGLRQTHPRTGWLIFCRGPVSRRLRARLKRREQRGVLRVIEGEETPSEVFSAMDLLFFCGRSGTDHDAVLEAAAQGIPTVGYATPQTREFVAQGQTGALVEMADLEGLQALTAGLLQDPNRLREMGLRARSNAALRFSRSAVDEQVLRLYDRVLEERLF